MKPDLEDQLRERLSPACADGHSCSRQLYAFAAGELSPFEVDAFQRHAHECPACRLDLAAFERHPMPAAPTRGERRPWTWRGLVLASAVAAVAITFWQWAQPHPGQPAEGAWSTLQTKGAPQLQIAVRRANQDLIAAPGQTFAEGDTLGFFYSSGQPVWPVIFYCNQQGSVTRIFPKAEPELLPPASGMPLPAGALVQPASGCEWLVGFFSPEPLRPSYEQLVAVLQKALAAHTPACGLEPMSPGTVTQVWPLLRSPSP
jgi:hypothetical protein